MPKLYVLGGTQRKSLLKNPTEEWHWYENALILEVDTDTGQVRTRVQYKTPPEARASEKSSINFHAATLLGNTLYTCTTTEVLIFRVPDFEQVGYVSLPHFNDVHHVAPSPDGNLLVVSTGLDMVVKCTLKGEVLEEFNPGDREDIHAVFLGRGGPLPARVRAFVDFLAEHVRVDD